MSILKYGLSILLTGVITVYVQVTYPVIAQTPQSSPVQPLKIEITKIGFEPATTTIVQGSPIIFQNNDDQSHWPASNIHPTHDVYPEFDSKKPITSDQTWEFVPTRTGEWLYHDHLNPTHNGKIIVIKDPTRKDVISKPSLKWFDQLKISYHQVKLSVLSMYYQSFPTQKDKALTNLTLVPLIQGNKDFQLATVIKLFGPEILIKKLFTESDNNAKFNCHGYAHEIGRLAYKLDKETSLVKNITLCHSGYIHGSMAAFINEKGTAQLVQDADAACEKAKNNFEKLTCYHGVGHGIMAYQNNNLPQAIEKCQDFNDNFKSFHCLIGVFMENIGADIGDSVTQHPTEWLKKSDPQYPCNAIDPSPQVQIPCYAIQPQWMLVLNKGDLPETANQCLSATQNGKKSCFFGYGQSAISIARFETNKMVSYCKDASNDSVYQSQCFDGLQAVLMDFWGPNLTTQGDELCNAEPEQFKTRCWETLATRQKELGFK